MVYRVGILAHLRDRMELCVCIDVVLVRAEVLVR